MPDRKELVELGKKAKNAIYIDLLNRIAARQASIADYRLMRELDTEFNDSSDDASETIPTFPNLLRALEYLQSQGYLVKKSKLYKDAKAGLVKRTAKDGYTSIELDRYAITADLPRVNVNPDNQTQNRLEELQREKLEATTNIAKEQLSLLQKRNLDIDAEITKRISSEIVNFLNLQRVVITTYFTAETPALIELVRGDQKYAPEFIAATREGISKSGATVARLKGMGDVRVGPDGTLYKGNEVL